MWGGPTLGLLAVRTGTRWRSPFPEDDRESGRVPGAPDVVSIVAAAAALHAVVADQEEVGVRHAALVDRIRRDVPTTVPDVEVVGDPVDRLPHIVTFSCLYVDGEALLTGLDRHGFAVSSGSSCTSSTLEPSHVLVAMGALTGGNVRVSLHPGVDEAQVQRFLAVLGPAVARVRGALDSGPTGRPATPTGPATAAGQAARPAPTGGLEPGLVDSRGRRCPLPVLDLARALPEVEIGGELTVLADDPAAAGDLAAWCRMTGQQLIASTAGQAGATAYRVRRVR
jgi:cysteine desulfurase